MSYKYYKKLNSIFNWRNLLLSLLSLGLTGCAPSLDYESKSNKEKFSYINEDIFKDLNDTTNKNTKLHWDNPWVNKKPKLINKNTVIPNKLNKELLIQCKDELNLKDFLDLFIKITSIPIRVSLDAEAKLEGKFSIKTDSSSSGAFGLSSNKSQSDKNNSDILKSKKLNSNLYKGKVKDILDCITAELGLFWRYSQGQVQWYYLDTRVFQIDTIATENALSIQINSNGTADSSGGSSNLSKNVSGSNSVQNASMQMNTNILEDIKSNLDMMITSGIGRYSIATSTGAVTVLDTEDSLQKIESYIEKINKLLNKQILVNVKVLSITLTDKKQSEINWSAVAKFPKLNDSTFSFSTGNSIFDGSNIDIKNGSEFNISDILSVNSVELLISALEEQGEVSVLSSPSVTTLNLHHVPIQIGTQENYISKETTTITRNSDGSSDKSVSLEPASISSGLCMSVLPFAKDNNEILLQYSLNLSELVSINKVSGSQKSNNSQENSGSTVSLPKVNSKIFSQKVKILSGKTLVLSGFEQVKSSKNESSPSFFRIFKRLFGSGGTDKEHTTILILISPIVVN